MIQGYDRYFYVICKITFYYSNISKYIEVLFTVTVLKNKIPIT